MLFSHVGGVYRKIIRGSVMSTIFINGLKSKTGGGKSILNNYLTLLKESNSKDKFIVLTPDKNIYEKYTSEFIIIIDIKALYKNNAFFLILYYFIIPKILRDYTIDLIFNLGDIPIPTKIPQLYLFDWAYGVSPKSIAWKKMDSRSYLIRKVKLYLFKTYIKYATIVIAQTKTMKRRLESTYGLNNIIVVPNAVSIENRNGGIPFNFKFPKTPIKLLCLTYYYSHKNLEIFIPLAKQIKIKALPFCIVITIHESQHKRSKNMLNKIKTENLEDVIINVGPIEMEHIPSLYMQCDALLLPTLLESFSGVYVEAMFHKKTILTSHFDFAYDVCNTAAYYFDPLSVESILNSIIEAFSNENVRQKNILDGKQRLNELLSWDQVFIKYQELINEILIM